jgi:uncharacterized protein (TIGR00725 family)
MARRPPLVAVCGTSTASPSQEAVAESLGRLLAHRGAVVVCGGGGGVMEAVCRGVAGAGGTSVGLLPGDDPDEAGAHVGLALPTGLGELRNGLIARMCRAMIVVGGGYGTLSEVGFMLRIGRPVCALDSWRLLRPGDAGEDPGIHRAGSAEAAVEWVFARLQPSPAREGPSGRGG